MSIFYHPSTAARLEVTSVGAGVNPGGRRTCCLATAAGSPSRCLLPVARRAARAQTAAHRCNTRDTMQYRDTRTSLE